MYGIGMTELLVVGLVGMILFGHRLPKVMRDLGRSITEFREGMRHIE